MTFSEAKNFARKNGFPFSLDWEKIRSPEGYYAINGCVELCAARTKEFLKFADMAWMETDSPNIEVASKYAVEC